MFSNQRETGIGMIERYVRPFRGFMTGTTVAAKLAVVMVILGMAGIASRRCVLIGIIHMTGCTGNLCMRTRQRKARTPMIEMYILPCGRFMATCTVRAELTVVFIVGGMTGITIRRSTSIYTIGMAIDTCQSAVTACQWEARFAVIEVNILPVAGVMTIGAVASHLPGMRICVAGGTVHGCALEQKVLMTARTGNADMLSYQMKGRLGVIEGHIFPGGGLMAGCTILSEQALMRIILFMTGETIHGRAFEHIVNMTAATSYVDVPG